MKKIFTLSLLASLLLALPYAAEAKKVPESSKPVARASVQKSDWRVKVAQQRLLLLGLSKERPSGFISDETAAALKKFQARSRLKPTGRLDDETYKKLNWCAFLKEGIGGVQGQEIVRAAASFKGVPYKFGGTTPKAFDCSGYVQYVFHKFRATLPRTADAQALSGIFVTQKKLRAGDLVFFTTYEPGASHVGIYAGDNKFWHASSSRGVMLSSLKEDYWRARYYGARRVLIANGEV